jgi:hypothetical protein
LVAVAVLALLSCIGGGCATVGKVIGEGIGVYFDTKQTFSSGIRLRGDMWVDEV